MAKKGFDKNAMTEVVISETTVLKGDISTKSGMRIDGDMVGNITSEGNIAVGASGKVEGEIVCRDIMIAGSVRGNIYAQGALTICEKAELIGDMTAQSIKIEAGANFQGKCEVFNKERHDKKFKPAIKEEKKNQIKKEKTAG